MSTAPEQKAKHRPKGGRKGGSVFPRITLSDALGYARKLVSKTHTGAQPAEVVLSGVMGSKTDTGKIRMSALKQYALLEGDSKTNYWASDLAKKINAAPDEEAALLYRQAILSPTIFKKIFDTFHGDAVSKAKLKQRAADLNVHPDSTTACIDLYVAGMTTAKLVTVVDDQIKHISSSELAGQASEAAQIDLSSEQSSDKDEESDEDKPIDKDADQSADSETNDAGAGSDGAAVTAKGRSTSGPRAVFNVSVSLDSSLDIEKLQKQLELLKRFGAI